MPTPNAGRLDILDTAGKVVAQSMHPTIELAWSQAFNELDSITAKAGEEGTEKRYEDFWDLLGEIPAGRPGEAVLNDTEGRAALLFKVSAVR